MSVTYIRRPTVKANGEVDCHGCGARLRFEGSDCRVQTVEGYSDSGMYSTRWIGCPNCNTQLQCAPLPRLESDAEPTHAEPTHAEPCTQ